MKTSYQFLRGISIPSILILGFLWSCTTSKTVLTADTRDSSFSKKQTSLITSGKSEEPMRVFLITESEDSLLLRQKSLDVYPNPSDSILSHFVSRLYATVTDSASMGVGIAAPQVGILKNIIWVQRFDKEGFPFEEYLNPKILQYSEMKQTRREGCLSIPGRTDTLECRSYAILLEYDRLQGERKIEMVEGFTAVIFQHEIDHLNGILYLDHLKEEIGDAQRKKQ